MSDPWAEFPTTAPKAADPWADFPAEKPASKAYKGSILPFSVDENGKGRIDFDAGITGSLKRAFMTPGDVAAGKVDMNSEEGLGRALEMAGFASPLPPAARAGRLGTLEPRVPAPSSQALKEAADIGYNKVREMGVDYAVRPVTDMIGGVRMSLDKDGFIAEVAPKTHAILNKFANPPQGSVITVAGLEAARRAAQQAAKDVTNKSEAAAASRLIEGIDNFIAQADPRSVVAGPAAAAAETIVPARANSAAQKRSESLNGIEDLADLRAAASNSGRNLDNTLRQRVVDVLADPKRSRGFSDLEKQALEQFVFGDATRNGLRTASNMIGGGGGMGALVAGGGAGMATGGVLGAGIGTAIGAAVPVVGGLAKAAQNLLARQALRRIDEATRMRSPLYAETKAATPPVVNEMAGAQTVMGGGVASLLDQGSPVEPETTEQRYVRLLREGGA